MDAEETYEPLVDEVDPEARTPLPRARFIETLDYPMYDAENSISLRIPVLD